MKDEKDEKNNAAVQPEGTDNSAQVAEEASKKESTEAPEANASAEKSPREIIFERIRASRPDGKYDEDEEEYYRNGVDWLDELEKASKGYKDLSEKLAARFNENPEEATAFMDYLEGMPLVAAIRKNMGDEALTMQEGDEGWEEYQKAGETRKADRERLMNYAKEIQENSAASESAFDEWAKENEMDDEQKQAVWDLIHGDLEALMHGKLSKDVLNRYRNAINHDPDVEAAHEQGKVEGRGEAIEAKHKRMQGSGLPSASAGGDVNSEVSKDPREEMARRFRGWR